jgi:hypothetical protein
MMSDMTMFVMSLYDDRGNDMNILGCISIYDGSILEMRGLHKGSVARRSVRTWPLSLRSGLLPCE